MIAWFERPPGGAMAFGFQALIAHAAYSRSLPAGTIGSRTVWSLDHIRVGSTSISEGRAIEAIADDTPKMPFLSACDRVIMCAGSQESCFGTIDQPVVRAERMAKGT